VPRVDGKLAMTRAFSDESLKEHITAEPDIVIEMIDADTEFIIRGNKSFFLLWFCLILHEPFE